MDAPGPASSPIPMAAPILGPEERRLVLQCLDENWISSHGGFVEQLERRFAEYVGARRACAVSSGTAALSLALLAVRLQAGDEVIMPTLTYGATGNAVLLAGGVPRLVASDQAFWQMDPEDVARSVTARTRGIIAVHLYGHPVDMDALVMIARERGLWVIEDAAEAQGSEFRGRRVGTLGDIGCFSFYANKLVTTGEGGMCVTNDRLLGERLERCRNQGMCSSRRYWQEEVGMNCRMTNIQAALGVAQMEKADGFLAAKRSIAAQYSQALAWLVRRGGQLQAEADWARSSFWMYNVILPGDVDRGEVIRRMCAKGIDVRPFFYPLHMMPAYRSVSASERCLAVEDFALRGLTLPSGADLSVGDGARVVGALAEANDECAGATVKGRVPGASA